MCDVEEILQKLRLNIFSVFKIPLKSEVNCKKNYVRIIHYKLEILFIILLDDCVDVVQGFNFLADLSLLDYFQFFDQLLCLTVYRGFLLLFLEFWGL